MVLSIGRLASSSKIVVLWRAERIVGTCLWFTLRSLSNESRLYIQALKIGSLMNASLIIRMSLNSKEQKYEAKQETLYCYVVRHITI